MFLEALSKNVEGDISSSLINLCHYIAEYYEDKFISAASDSSLTFSSRMTIIENASTINDFSINISQLCILLKIYDTIFVLNYLNLKPKWTVYMVT